MVFYVIYGLTLLFPCFYLYKNGRRIELFNIFLILILLFFGPAFFIYNNIIDDSSTTEAACLALMIIFLFIGRAIRRSFSRKKAQINNQYDIYPIQRRVIIYSQLLKFLFVITFIIFYLALFQYGGINNLMIVLRSGGGLTPTDLKELRFDFKIDGWIGSIIGYLDAIARLLSMIVFAYSIQEKKRLIFVLNCMFCFLIILWGVSTLHKAIAFFYVLQLFLFFYLRNKKQWLWNSKTVIQGAVLIAFLIIPIYLLVTSNEGIDGAASAAFSRVTDEPNRVLREYFIFWPNKFDHKLGLNIRQIHAIFGEGEFEPAYKTIIYEYIPDDTPLVGSWPAIYIADAWVDFSYFGVVLYSIMVGFVLTIIDDFLKYYSNAYGAALFSALVGSLFGLMENSFFTILLTGGLGILPFLFRIIVKVRQY